MSLPIPTLSFSSSRSVTHKSLHHLPSIISRNPSQTLPFQYPSCKIRSFKPNLSSNGFGLSARNLGFGSGRRFGFCVSAENGDGESKIGVDSEAEDARGESTMPSRFRYLTKEAPETPVRWPWLIALAFLVYAWRAVLFELSNWRKAALGIVHFVGYLLKLVVALIFSFIGDPVTSFIRFIEDVLYTVRAFYSSIVAYAPVPELMAIIILASAVLAIAEATVPNSAKSQPYLLTVSGLIGYAAVSGIIIEPFFWTLLLGTYCFSRFVKKRDDVTAALPAAAVLAGIGEPWVRVIVMASYLALAIYHNSKKSAEKKEEDAVEAVTTWGRVPLPLLGAALAIGIRVAAKWAGYRHLTWMIV